MNDTDINRRKKVDQKPEEGDDWVPITMETQDHAI